MRFVTRCPRIGRFDSIPSYGTSLRRRLPIKSPASDHLLVELVTTLVNPIDLKRFERSDRVAPRAFPKEKPMTSEDRKIRVLVAKPGLDGHDRGAKVIAASFRDAGFEVIYTGLHQTPEMIVNAAVQEDVDVVALSVLSGAHMTLFPRVLGLLREEGADEVLLTGGGIIPEEDMRSLADQGVGRLFGPGTSTVDAVAYVRDWFATREERV